MIESVEDVRTWCDDLFQTNSVEVLKEKLDAIEREVEQNYIELPKDMNGECIRIGDTLETADSPRACMKVRYIAYDGEYYAIEDEYTEPPTFFPNFLDMCHHKPPTVEDVLREFAYCFEDGVTDKSLDEIVAEYAPKLRLVNDEDFVWSGGPDE